MSPNFPGSSNALPDTYVDVETLSSGASVPSGTRTMAIMGEGSRRETLVSTANGSGNDGLNPSYTGTGGRDGRHFLLTFAPVVSNRTTLYKNGIPLVGVEGDIDGTSFSSVYDYKLDPTNGQIELQSASLVDQGGKFYTASTLNTGNGVINNLTLEDENALNESWVIRCASVQRDGYGEPIPNTARFIATGSVSGTLLDGYGNVVTWISNNTVNSNGVLRFSIEDGSVTFREGDRFGVEVTSGVLESFDSLTVTYIAEADINDVEFFSDFNSLTAKHGNPSITNRLSLGGQLCFSNNTPGTYTVQCAPSIPRRISYTLSSDFDDPASVDDYQFPLPLNVIPDVNTNINFFITDPVTGVESQILPNKVDFYQASIEANPDAFVTGETYSYTVILDDGVVKSAKDGYVNPISVNQAEISSSTIGFDTLDLSATRSVRIFDATNVDNNGIFEIVSVSNGVATIQTTGSTFVSETGVEFEVIDSAIESAKILLTQDIAIVGGGTVRATIVDQKDANFFDAGWVNAYEALETINTDIIVPLPSQTISVIFQNGIAHVRAMSNIKNKKERHLYIGAIRGLTPANVIGTEPAAAEDIGILEGIQGDDVTEILDGNTEDLTDYGVQAAYGNTYRCVYHYPDEIVVQLGGDRVFVDGFFIAAGHAGYLCGNPTIQTPSTKKVIAGFTILRNKLFRPQILEDLVASGITVLQPVQGGGKIIRGQTTTNSGFLEEREISIVFIRDRIAKTMRNGFEGFVGQAESPTLVPNLTARAVALLNGFIGQGIITQWTGLSIKQDGSDPTQWNIVVKVQPAYPVNFIYIRVDIGLLN